MRFRASGYEAHLEPGGIHTDFAGMGWVMHNAVAAPSRRSERFDALL